MRLTLLRAVKFGPQVKELRIHLCQNGEESKGVRYGRFKNSTIMVTQSSSVFIFLVSGISLKITTFR